MIRETVSRGEKVKDESVISGFLWRFTERCGAQIVAFVVLIVLARILLPEDSLLLTGTR